MKGAKKKGLRGNCSTADSLSSVDERNSNGLSGITEDPEKERDRRHIHQPSHQSRKPWVVVS